MPTLTGTIEQLYANHTAPVKFPSFKKWRYGRYKPARITLWAVVNNGDHVWLKTREPLDTRRIDTKTEELVKENEHLLHQTIAYNYKKRSELGFIREYKTQEPKKEPYQGETHDEKNERG